MSRTFDVATEQLERIRGYALRSSDESRRARYIDAADTIIMDLVLCGCISDQEGARMSRQWVDDYSAARFGPRIGSIVSDQHCGYH